MNKRKPSFLPRLILAALGIGAWRVYARRTLERIPSQEGIEDEAVSQGFDWVSRMPQMQWLRQYIARRVSALKTSGEAVDLGCGPGYLVFELARQLPGLRVTGLDVSPGMVDVAAEQARRTGLEDRAAFRLGNAQAIPFEDASLDLVVSTLSLHHWQDPAAVLDEIDRVLKPGGAFLIFDLRRDLELPFYLLLWFATQFVVPAALHRINEPLGSRNASYTVSEVADLARRSRLKGWQASAGPLWVILEGKKA